MSSVALDDCISLQPGRYGFNCGPQTLLTRCDSQTAGTADYYVVGTTMIGCTEYTFGAHGNAVRINNDNTPWGPNPNMPTTFIGCSFTGAVSVTVPSEENGSMIDVTWINAYAVFVGCTFQAGSATTDWVWIDSRNTLPCRVLFNSCQFGVFGSHPVTRPFNANGTAAVLSFRSCPGLDPFGTRMVAVPATGVAVAADVMDRTFYVTAGVGGCTMAIQDGPSVVIPTGALGTVRVPAGQAVTPTYTATPTWVVEGE